MSYKLFVKRFLSFLNQSCSFILDVLLRLFSNLRPHKATNENMAVSIAMPRSALNSQQVVVVLGMHRSGTSLLTGTLQEAGLVLGDVVTSAPHNRKGNREALPIRALHDDLLQCSGGSWCQPPAQVVWQSAHRLQRDQIIAGFQDELCWGFKDPRSLFCLKGWLEVLPKLHAVAIVRHPEAVARSLLAREGMPLEDGLVLWKLYNEQLLYWMDRIEVSLLHFTPDLDAFCADAEVLIAQLGLPRLIKAQALQFPDANLHHQQSSELLLPRDIQALYSELIARKLTSNVPY
ncbi:sulfotransferase family protein [bacterium]|nr:sulfotransferase family protein [bacterium]